MKEIESLLTEQELETLELQYIASQHKVIAENPLLKTCVKLLYRNQILEKENKTLKKSKTKIIEYINNKTDYDKLYHYNKILDILKE